MKFDKEKMRLYAITDRHWLNGRSLKEVVKESLDGGVTFLQLRDKNSDDETFLQEATELQELCRDYKVPLIINDNVEIALKMNADGVHVCLLYTSNMERNGFAIGQCFNGIYNRFRVLDDPAF